MNVYIQAGIVTLPVYIYAMFASVCLCPPVHMYGFPGTLFVETSWAAATWPHPPFPRGCSEGLGLAAASTARATVNRLLICRCRGLSWQPGAPLPSLSLKVLSAPPSVSHLPTPFSVPSHDSNSLLWLLIHSPHSRESDLLEMQISSPPQLHELKTP